MTVDIVDELGVTWVNQRPPGAASADEPKAAGTAPSAVAAESGATVNRFLTDVEAFVRRYVMFPTDHEPTALALWVAHTHCADKVETSPILAVTSAEMRSGKTRVLDLLELLVPNPERCVLPSESVLYTLLSQEPRPTLLIDEADAIFANRRQAERYEGVRGVLNAGNRKGTTVPRVRLDGKKRGVDRFDVYGPKAIAGIGDLPATIADRAIPIRLKRRAPDEPVAKFRRRVAGREAAAITVPHVAHVPLAPVPDELPDRAADSWEVLIGLATVAGGNWPMRARQAAIALSGEDAPCHERDATPSGHTRRLRRRRPSPNGRPTSAIGRARRFTVGRLVRLPANGSRVSEAPRALWAGTGAASGPRREVSRVLRVRLHRCLAAIRRRYRRNRDNRDNRDVRPRVRNGRRRGGSDVTRCPTTADSRPSPARRGPPYRRPPPRQGPDGPAGLRLAGGSV